MKSEKEGERQWQWQVVNKYQLPQTNPGDEIVL